MSEVLTLQVPDNSVSTIPDILDAISQRDGQRDVIEIEEPNVQCVVIRLEDKCYALYGEQIKEIVAASEIAFVPGMPEYIVGVIHLRGEIESVLALRSLLGMPSVPRTKRSRIVIGQINSIRSGILVDSVEDVMELPESSIQVPVSSLDPERSDYVLAESTYNDQELIILDLGKIFMTLLEQ